MSKIIRCESLVFFIGSIFLYNYFNYSWIMFLVLLLAPDISMLFYLVNKKVGSFMYNIFHTYSIPLGIFIVNAFSFDNQIVSSVCIIMFSHISLDRFIGYGLKYKDSFKETHIQKLQ